MPTPAEQLSGVTLNGGWVVGKLIPRIAGHTGGYFSSSYHVIDGTGKPAFLKAMDYTRALSSPDPAAALNAMTNAYLFERNILQECAEKKMSRIVRAIEAGKVILNGTDPVEYLIFELASGDIRTYLDAIATFDLKWTLSCLHNIFVGIQQLNSARIAHQDLKPSNVLTFASEGEKIADLGRAWHSLESSPHDHINCAGDKAYAPPELLYGYPPADENERRYGADFYLLGSMVLFLFTGMRATTFLMNDLDPSHYPTNWHGSYQDVLPYLEHAFSENLVTLNGSFADKNLGKEIVSVIGQMCHPNIALRGDMAHKAIHGSRFGLQRFISLFDRLRLQAALGRMKYP
jgi:serine/threonine protein kinase